MNYYDHKQAAEVLQYLDPLNVLRSIARERLKATTLGRTGNRVILKAWLDEYIASGAPDHEPPPKAEHRIFDDSENRSLESSIMAALWKAAGQQFESNDMIQRVRLSRDPGDKVELSINNAMFAVLNEPYPEPHRIERKRREGEMLRYEKQGDFLFAMLLRREAKTPREKLYESPEAYGEHTQKILAEVAKRRIGERVDYTPTEVQAATLREKGRPAGMFTVWYYIPIGALMKGWEERALAAAF